MNKRIFELAKQVDLIQWDTLPSGAKTPDHESVVKAREFAELIVEECRNIVIEVYRNTPLELCGSLLIVDEKISEHFFFYGVEE